MANRDDDIERYKGIDLETFKELMTPAMFKAFYENIGVIRGSPDLDISNLTDCHYEEFG